MGRHDTRVPGAPAGLQKLIKRSQAGSVPAVTSGMVPACLRLELQLLAQLTPSMKPSSTFLPAILTVAGCFAYLLAAPWAPEGSRRATQSPGDPSQWRSVTRSGQFDLFFPLTSTSEASQGTNDRYPRGLNTITTWTPESLHTPNEPLFPSMNVQGEITQLLLCIEVCH